VQVKLEYIPKDAGTWKPSGAQGTWTTTGKDLIMTSDCKACHRFDTTVIGPAFTAVSQRYQNKPDEIPRLASKIITGGSGVWGEHYMNAHPQLSKDQTTSIVKYILSLAQQQTINNLPASGTVSLKALANNQGTYVLTAAYTDADNGVVPLTNTNELVLRPTTIEGEDVDVVSNIERNKDYLGSINNNSYFVLKAIDLKGIKSITYNYASKEVGATLEVHAGSPKGAVISTLNYQPTGDWNKYKQATAPIQDSGGKHDLYFVFKKDTKPNWGMFSLDWLKFNK